MCGICGVVDLERATSEAVFEARVSAMATAMAHRGPDDAGLWVDPAAGVALGHRRLSVIDLSPAGHQPMVSASGRYVISFNGEVYDHRRLSAELAGKGHRFRGHSDTEVLLASVEEWGLAGALERANAMFALALWDRRERTLTLARDRVGEKPLLWARRGPLVLFASELGALRTWPGLHQGLDPDALTLYFRYKAIPAPHTVYRDVHKLEPGHLLTVGPEGPRPSSRWWHLPDPPREAVTGRQAQEEVVDQAEELLADAVGLRLDADVPVGAFLSGGLDSTTVVAFAQEQAHHAVRTYTVANEDPRFDESEGAAAVAAALGTRHTTLTLSDSEVRAAVPDLARVWDEPFGDSSQLPALLVARLARSEVTVALTGDGGDELFGGYNRYRWVPAVWGRAQGWPLPLRRRVGDALARVPDRWWERGARLVPERRRPRLVATKAAKLAAVLGQPDPAGMYLRLTSHWEKPGEVVSGGVEPATLASTPQNWPTAPTLAQQLMAVDLLTYLPDDILTKVDRATMSVGLEGRLPLLDPRLVDLSRSLPADLVTGTPRPKWVLHRLAARRLSEGYLDRPKMGFGVPVGSWLRGPLRGWAQDLLSPDSLGWSGVLDAASVGQRWNAHLAGDADHTYELWDVLMFQAWWARWEQER